MYGEGSLYLENVTFCGFISLVVLCERNKKALFIMESFDASSKECYSSPFQAIPFIACMHPDLNI